MQTSIKPLESPGLSHVVLAGHLLFCWTSKDLQCARDSSLLEVVLECDRGTDRGRANQIMPTTMAVRISARGRCPRGLGVVTQAGQSIIFDQDADGGTSAAPGGDPRRVKPTDSSIADGESMLFKQGRSVS